jgi:hypothetical protein
MPEPVGCVRDPEQTHALLEAEAIAPAKTPPPHPASMATQDIVIWTPARVARAFAAAMLRFPVPAGRRLMPKA